MKNTELVNVGMLCIGIPMILKGLLLFGENAFVNGCIVFSMLGGILSFLGLIMMFMPGEVKK